MKRGWKFGLARFTPCEHLPSGSKYICEGCYPIEKRKAKKRENALASEVNQEQEVSSFSLSSSGSFSSDDDEG